MKILAAINLVLASSMFAQTPSPAPQKHPFTFEDMMKLKRVGAPVPSPDGKWVVFDCEDVDLAANTKTSHLWTVPASGGESRRLNPTPNHEERPRFSPDGKRLIWTSKATDPTQIWMCDFDSNGGSLVGKPHQVTNISTGADGAIWSQDGKNVVFVSAVYPDCADDACNKQRDEQLKKSKVKAKIFSRLFYRHWNAFTEFKRSHLFVVSAEANETGGRSSATPGSSPVRLGPGSQELAPPNQEPRDLTPGDHDVPPFSLGGQDMYAISPDGQEVAYTSNIDEVEATSTNNEIFVVPISGGTPKKISVSPGSDTTPLYSPDGTMIAWRSQARAGFEADKWRLLVQDRQSGKTRDLTEKFDRSVGSFTWFGTSALLLTAEDHGASPIFVALPARPDGPEIIQFKEPGSAEIHADDLVWSKNTLFFTRMSAVAPNEIWKHDDLADEGPIWEQKHPAFEPLTHMNDAVLSQIDMQPLESFTFKGANDEDVQGFMVKPPGFDPKKKYPLKFLLHGGPQGAWGNEWTYRWNAELFAATGNYVVVMINFHGSTGYGQKFTDSISGDWGGKPYVDLMKGLDYVERPTVHRQNREGSAGASYGGYMANWLLGHTNRFKCIVSHDGMFNASRPTAQPRSCGLRTGNSAVHRGKTGCLPEMVTTRVCREFQNADASRARSERLPARCVSRFRFIHDTASAESAVENVVFPGRRPLGAQAAELAALV
ncbi:MAG: Dipeptidyl-peptidase 5 [Candidatus Udaeobacter sp.]|nr:MAG: Dipeptidyl-peptidase 5 [Candidatus Udaeobacter sp.]